MNMTEPRLIAPRLAAAGALVLASSIAHAVGIIEMPERYGRSYPDWLVWAIIGSLALIGRRGDFRELTAIYAGGFTKFLNWCFWIEIAFELIARVAHGDPQGMRTLLIVWGAGQAGLFIFLSGCKRGQEQADRDRLRPKMTSSTAKNATADKSVACENVLREVAWMPKQIVAPAELLVVRVQPGVITEQQWWDALSDRVRAMAIAAGPEATSHASRTLGMDVAWTSDPNEAGQCLVGGNWNLRTHLTLAMQEDEFPAIVKEDDADAVEAIEETDLQSWAELAAAQVSASSLE
jgi:hypothetical protein